jgi:hypothetical protein
MLQPGVLKIAAHLGRTPCEGPRLDFETVGDPYGVFRPLRERRRHHPLPPECVWFQTSSRGSGRLT